MFITVLIISLLSVFFVILFAFFPIRTNWFFRPTHNDFQPAPKKKRHGRGIGTYTKDIEYFEEVYDDPEL